MHGQHQRELAILNVRLIVSAVPDGSNLAPPVAVLLITPTASATALLALYRLQDVWLTADDGTKLHAWLLVPRGWNREQVKEQPVFLFFQENAGNMSHRLPFLRLIAQQLQVSIFAPRCAGGS